MRATLDLDDPTDLDVLKTWHRLAEYGDGAVHGRVSSSGSGVHLKVHGCSEQEVAEARARLGDDEKRRAFDEQSDLKPPQILFSSKPVGDGAGEWTTDLDRVLAEYRRRAPLDVRYPDAPARW